MSAPAFTKGPWFGDGREKETGDILVYAPEAKHGYRDICFIPEDDEQDAANARLIAAAPELYELAEQFERVAEYELRKMEREKAEDDKGIRLRSLNLALIRATLAKARGEQQ